MHAQQSESISVIRFDTMPGRLPTPLPRHGIFSNIIFTAEAG
jgi:hypothetical protein